MQQLLLGLYLETARLSVRRFDFIQPPSVWGGSDDSLKWHSLADDKDTDGRTDAEDDWRLWCDRNGWIEMKIICFTVFTTGPIHMDVFAYRETAEITFPTRQRLVGAGAGISFLHLPTPNSSFSTKRVEKDLKVCLRGSSMLSFQRSPPPTNKLGSVLSFPSQLSQIKHFRVLDV